MPDRKMRPIGYKRKDLAKCMAKYTYCHNCDTYQRCLKKHKFVCPKCGASWDLKPY